MKKYILLFLFLMIGGVAIVQPEFQTRPTACTIDKHRFELSLFAPSRYGIGEKTEVFTSVLGDVMIPNVGLKHRWFTKPAQDEGGARGQVEAQGREALVAARRPDGVEAQIPRATRKPW